VRRFAVAAVVLLGLLAVGVAAAPARSGRTYASSCGNLRVRPHVIVLTCADANFQLRRLHWRRWGVHRAFGRGRVVANDCIPFCAAGHFHRYRARVKLGGGLTRCHGHRVFRRVRIRYVRRHPPGSGRVVRSPLACF
jgi:hypothetical protein